MLLPCLQLDAKVSSSFSLSLPVYYYEMGHYSMLLLLFHTFISLDDYSCGIILHLSLERHVEQSLTNYTGGPVLLHCY